MATLTVMKFEQPEGAEQALHTLRRLQQQLIQIVDAAVVEWPPDRKAPRTRQAVDTCSVRRRLVLFSRVDGTSEQGHDHQPA